MSAVSRNSKNCRSGTIELFLGGARQCTQYIGEWCAGNSKLKGLLLARDQHLCLVLIRYLPDIQTDAAALHGINSHIKPIFEFRVVLLCYKLLTLHGLNKFCAVILKKWRGQGRSRMYIRLCARQW